uniref:Uncharacterized protein n=1 Tax=Candidatus Kentrum eta TaxID=2126337 RepID=A0A450ULM1_9GAMM|nr:MAG: hypothetical protein BECKH772A_GA0070896_100567 [Candidatus Kentron sp. H]VFJ94100.1 MAG: hypothetical protein BECKH772B_GA0070898_100558 [Candidatus Kentron sp. H]VFK02275.1 MAG: hypothetical protein BECKH772C_GA0070978_100867 [Candidatus Kentron sp. H]
MKNHLIYLLLLAASTISDTPFAVEIAPRITDREIVERLVRLEEGQKAIQKQLDDRLDSLWNLTTIMLAAIFGLIGFVVWDRKTALKPLEERLQKITDDLERDLDLGSSEGSKLTRLMNALRELAPNDPRLADALRRHFLL